MSDTENFNASGDPAKKAYDQAQKAFKDATDPKNLADAQAALGMDPAKMQETLRAMTERSMEQSKQAYSKMKSATDEATRTLESTLENAHGGSLSLSKKAIEALRSNAEMGFSHLESLASAKSMAEMIELQTSFVRRQMEAAADQARDMQSLSQSVAQELMRPGTEAVRKATSERS